MRDDVQRKNEHENRSHDAQITNLRPGFFVRITRNARD